MSDISEFRREIDRVDSEIIELLSKRLEITKLVRAYKIENNISARSNGRWQELTKLHEKHCKKVGLDYKLAEPLFELIHEYVLENIHRGIPDSKK